MPGGCQPTHVGLHMAMAGRNGAGRDPICHDDGTDKHPVVGRHPDMVSLADSCCIGDLGMDQDLLHLLPTGRAADAV
jgi:hypothetical protein